MTRPDFTLLDVKRALRAGPYAWPGGYPLFFVMADGEALSFDAARAQWREIVGAMLCDHNPRDQWRVLGCDVNYEDSDLYCAHTGKRIPSAYAEPEEESAA